MDDSNTPRPAPRKLKYQPKLVPKKEPKVVKPKLEPHEASTENVIDHNLIKLVKQAEQGSANRTFKTERKIIQGQVSFGYVDSKRGGFGIRHLKKDSDDKAEKEYNDDWNYNSYYPVTLPLRLPHSGNPEFLDKEEFGEDRPAYDESYINAARELGVMEDGGRQMLFFQFPSHLPMGKRSSVTAKGKEDVDTKIKMTESGCKLEELPAGFMGKLLVYKSGRIKMKLGDSLFDVSPGSECVFAQDVMAINTVEKSCCVLDEKILTMTVVLRAWLWRLAATPATMIVLRSHDDAIAVTVVVLTVGAWSEQGLGSRQLLVVSPKTFYT